MWARRLPAALAVALALAACSTSGGSKAVDLPSASGGGTFALSSTAFSDGGPIPARFTCDGEPVEVAAGGLLHVTHEVTREAVALEDGTAIICVGGVPGQPYTPS